ncbi:hypothetical protein ABZ468_49680 [Streptomyces sp. NPDC005708]
MSSTAAALHSLHEVRKTDAELDAFALEWAASRGLALWSDRSPH